ncbi:MAG: hypothetical protein A4E30_00880 [Methanomassiliicoccales archaeon PtaB.Bin215]|nr:MAG: hypothetical protein A4E30_00880 [Methanomassiliicoccales archaeon PtaB.Bin215]
MNFFNKTIAGYLLALAAGQFLIALMLGESMAPGYSMHDNAISDLGTIAESELLFNASLFLIGLLNFAAGYVLYKAIGDRKVLIAFALGGIGAMGAGLIPLDHPSGVHGLFALFAFVFINVEAMIAGRLAKFPLNRISLLLGILGIIFVPVMIMVDSGSLDVTGSIGHGGVERMIAFPCLIWMLVFGGYLIASPELRG